ncbi:MAG: helix-turn-helix transcriptional regulator, partial [Muribaculum sp.]
ELTSAADASILSRREKQVLTLIDSGKRSYEIAEILSISKNTVSRHRQEILAKLQVKNSMEACRIAKAMKII